MKKNINIMPDKYRPDIDGLRAIAVLGVVGFHAFPRLVAGGFIGVDVFFIISGFLISAVIFENLKNDEFSFLNFYARRVRRIFPALLVVLIACLIMGWFTLWNDEYLELGRHVAGGAGFVSNLLSWSEAGYFDRMADTKLLLHLWSLGIEEQFYIICPLLFWLGHRLRINLLAVTTVAVILSFALNVRGISAQPVAIFYSPVTRCWELLLGSLLAWMTLHTQNRAGRFASMWMSTSRNLLSVAGMLLLGYCGYSFTKDLSFPGYWALLPVLSAILIISAGAGTLVNRFILSNQMLVWIGLISFPLYLWHWPLLAFARIIEGETPDKNLRAAAVATSFVLAWLTYRFVERPIRFGGRGNFRAAVLLGLMVVVGGLGYATNRFDGFPSRALSIQLKDYEKSMITSSRRQCMDVPYAYKKSGDWFCKIGTGTANPTVFAYGDSHAFSLLPALEKLAVEKNITILFASDSGCLPLLGVKVERGQDWHEKHNCPELNNRIFEYIKNNGIQNVFLISYWTYYYKEYLFPAAKNTLQNIEKSTLDSEWKGGIWYDYGLRNTLRKYQTLGVQVYLFEDNPTQRLTPKDTIRKALYKGQPINQQAVSKSDHLLRQNYISQKFASLHTDLVTVVNFDDLLCSDDRCSIEKDGVILYSDIHHLSATGALLVYPRVSQIFNTLKK